MFKFVVKRNSKELFHRAIAENDIVRVKLLLDQCKEDPNFNIDEINEEGLTALQNSCFIGNIDMVKLLVSSGANLKIKDREGWTLLHASVMAGNLDIVRFLVDNGLNIVSRTDRKEMPIDFAEDKRILVFLVKRMLEIGFSEEIQKYIKRNPHQKKEIYRQIEMSIQSKREEIKALESFPFTPREKRDKHWKEGKGATNVVNGENKKVHKHKVANRRSDPVKGKLSPALKTKNKSEIFTLDVDNLPETPVHKKWSSMSNLMEDAKGHLTDTKVKMHSGYETDGTEPIYQNAAEVKQLLKDIISGAHSSQKGTTDHPEMDLASVNSHSTSGYETDDNPVVYYTRPINYSKDNEFYENNNHPDAEYFKRSHTMSPRTMRRLEHRFGALVVNNLPSELGGPDAQQETGGCFKMVEFPEVFL